MDDLKIPQIKPEKSILTPENGVSTSQNLETPPVEKIEPKFTETEGVSEDPQMDPPTSKDSKTGKYIMWGLLALVVIFIVGILIPGFLVYGSATKLTKSAQNVKAAVATQNINNIKTSLTQFNSDLVGFQKTYRLLSLLRIIPVAGSYYNDGRVAVDGGIHGINAAKILITTAEPYADIIGFTGGAGAKSGEQNAENRIQFIVDTIGGVAPKLPELSKEMSLANADLSQIDPNRYPLKFQGKPVRTSIATALDFISQAADITTNAQPILTQAPYLLGVDGERTYLLIFQNDKELRPTGGFITAYSIIKVNKGKISQVTSNDIYNLDLKYKPTIPAPAPLIKYIKGPYILSQNVRLRDMNFAPDYKVSMDQFLTEAQKVGIPKVDGIIAVDTQVLVNILNVTGEVGVSGFGNYSAKSDARCNCPQVIYELESFADIEGPVIWDPVTGKIILQPPHADNRKKIVGPLMNSILSNALGQPKAKLPDLFKAAFDSLTEKHVLFYLLNPDAQKAAESFDIAGRVKDYSGDYLYINDANLGGRKSNLYVTQEVEQTINVKSDGSIEKVVNITYKNPEKQDGWLNSVLPDWVRVYVPKGSQLVSMEGVTDKANPYEEFGKTVFAGYFELRPQGVAKVTLTYRLPFKVKDLPGFKMGIYNELVQKQPGTNLPLYTNIVNKHQQEQFLKTDQEFKFKL